MLRRHLIRTRSAATVSLLALVFVVAALPAAPAGSPPGAPGGPQLFSVGIEGEIHEEVGDAFHDAEVLMVLDRISFMHVEAQDAAQFQSRAQDDPRVRYVEKTPEVRTFANDPRLDDQWGMHDTPGADAVTAWETSFGSTDTVVGVVDTGLESGHEDIGNVVAGHNFADDNDDTSDCDSHGTHVAGTVGALTDNGVGVAGVAQTSIMPLKVFGGGDCSGTFANVAAAILHAVDNNVDIISMSLGCAQRGCTHQGTVDALQDAADAGLLSVCAAGNSGPGGNSVEFPGNDPNCMAVSALTSSGSLAFFSSKGSEVEIAAAGSGVLSTCLNDSYCEKSGTSMAAPHVSGTAALALAVFPDLDGAGLRQLLKDTAVDVGLSADEQGAGAVNAANAVTGSGGGDPEPEPDGEMHVHAIDHRLQGPHLRVTVTVFDANENPVDGADVGVEICEGDNCVTRSGTTDSAGDVEVKWQHAGSGTYTSCVTSLTKDSITWDQEADHAADGNCESETV